MGGVNKKRGAAHVAMAHFIFYQQLELERGRNTVERVNMGTATPQGNLLGFSQPKQQITRAPKRMDAAAMTMTTHPPVRRGGSVQHTPVKQGVKGRTPQTTPNYKPTVYIIYIYIQYIYI